MPIFLNYFSLSIIQLFFQFLSHSFACSRCQNPFFKGAKAEAPEVHFEAAPFKTGAKAEAPEAEASEAHFEVAPGAKTEAPEAHLEAAPF